MVVVVVVAGANNPKAIMLLVQIQYNKIPIHINEEGRTASILINMARTVEDRVTIILDGITTANPRQVVDGAITAINRRQVRDGIITVVNPHHKSHQHNHGETQVTMVLIGVTVTTVTMTMTGHITSEKVHLQLTTIVIHGVVIIHGAIVIPGEMTRRHHRHLIRPKSTEIMVKVRIITVRHGAKVIRHSHHPHRLVTGVVPMDGTAHLHPAATIGEVECQNVGTSLTAVT